MERTYNNLLFIVIILVFVLGCQPNQKEETEDSFLKGSFAYDLAFLNKYKKTIVLQDDYAMIAICPDYQGRVMTSSSSGMQGLSYGWLNYELIKSGEVLGHFNPVGGEDRFWLGPEGGQFSIFFPPNSEFNLDNWQTPAAIDSEPFTLISRDNNSAVFEKEITLKNYSGHLFELKVNREVQLLSREQLKQYIALEDSVNFVAYQSKNEITNVGEQPWTKSTGGLSIWILGMMTPTEKTTVLVPFNMGNLEELGPVVNDNYFGKVPKDRLKIEDGIIFFKADGKHRSKIGLSASRALNYMGSFDANHNVLTIVYFSKTDETTDYVNSLWQLQKNPFDGDVANSYNDGPADGETLGPFYELESSSPAAFLGKGESMLHEHTTIHISGSDKYLENIIQQLFHTDLKEVKGAFQ